MTRIHGRLTALAVKHRVARGLHADGGGLYLQVARNGSRSWILRYRFNGRRRYCGLGALPAVSLADARERASAARLILQDGRDPIEVKHGQRVATRLTVAKAMSFAKAAAAYTETHRAGWGAHTYNQWTASLAEYAYPVIGALPVQEVDTALVTKIIEPIWATKTETASRVRGRIEKILDWATVRGFRVGENPARWKAHLELLLPAKTKVVTVAHHAAMAYDDLPGFMVKLRQRAGVTERALEFLILTAARTGEVLNATWDEIDLLNKTWTVPAARMKAGKKHRVPLADTTVNFSGRAARPA